MFADFLSFDVTDFPFGLRPGCERMMLARIAAYDPSAEIGGTNALYAITFRPSGSQRTVN